MRYAICYVSSAKDELQKREVKEIFQVSHINNEEHDVKGILLYSEGNFFHVLEGERSYVQELFEKIKKDERHHNIIQVLGKNISHGAYDGFETDIVTEGKKYSKSQFEEYLMPLQGMDEKTQSLVENILEVFIETRK